MARVLLVICLLVAASGLKAQIAASLAADRVLVTADGRLIAEGNVEVFYDGTRLSAARVTYSEAADRLTIDGPIFIEEAGGAILVAQSAALDPALRNGILLGARLVLERELQLAANRIDRIDGRFSALTGAAATSCQVCEGRAPLWEIRAAQVIHDEAERQLYFEDATFLVRGVPIARLPRLRLPDPTLERATGLLVPRIRTTDLLGVGLKLPYFITLGPSRDVTLTPYVSSRTQTLEARYRQAFLRGELNVVAAASQDATRDDPRAYLFADGAWRLGPGEQIGFALASVSDDAYLRDYDYATADRLESRLSYSAVGADRLTRADLTHVQTLRATEDQGSLPPLFLRASDIRTWDFSGGRLTWEVSADAFRRYSDDGRDVSRAGSRLNWGGQRVLPGGLLLDAQADLAAGAWRITDDPDNAGLALRTTPSLQTRLRWPLIRTSPTGTVHVLEPAAALTWSETFGDAIPNEDSQLVEFDEANLYALTRYPGEDAREDGLRLALGLSYTRLGPQGSEFELDLGRIYRDEADEVFSLSSGLGGIASEWLLSSRLTLPNGFGFSARTVFDDGFDFDKTEARIDWSNRRIAVSASYVWLPQEPFEGRDEQIAEWSAAGRWQVDKSWALTAGGRYDLASDRPVSASFGIGWRNECVEVDLSLERSYTESDDLEPDTDFGLGVRLSGFSAEGVGSVPPGRCRG